MFSTRFFVRCVSLIAVFAVVIGLVPSVSLGQVDSQSSAGSQPGVVAIVNGQPITREALGEECLLRYGEQVLDNLLNKKVIQQACEASSIVITKEEVQQEVGRIAAKLQLNSQLYLDMLQKERGIEAWQYQSDIIWPMLALRRLAADLIQVSQAEVDKAFESQYGPTVKVRMIVVSDPQKAQQIHQQVIADPEQFKRLAKMHSEDAASASVEGLLPPIRRFSGNDQLEQVAFGLQPNEISPVFQIGDSVIILQCVRHEPGTSLNDEQTPYILERIRSDLRDLKLQDKADVVFNELRKTSNVVTVLGDLNLEKQYPGVAAIVNRQEITRDVLAEQCIARFGLQTLEGEINRKLLEVALQQSNLQVTAADEQAEIGRAAAYYGFVTETGQPDVRSWLENVLTEDGATEELYVQDAVWPTVALKKLVETTVQISDEDLQQAFETFYGPRVEILAIVCSNFRTAKEVWEMARQNPTEQFFGELAAQYSVEPTSRSNYGKVPPIKKYGGQPKLEEVAFQLQPGEMSGVVEVNDQHIILRSQGFTNPVVQDISEVRNELYQDVLEKKLRVAMRQKMDELMRSASIQNFLEDGGLPQTVSQTPTSALR